MKTVVLTPSLGRPDKCARTVTQEAVGGSADAVIVGVAHGQLVDYARAVARELKRGASREEPGMFSWSFTDLRLELLEVPEELSHRGPGLVRAWLCKVAMAFGFDSMLFMDDDVTVKKGNVGYLFESMQHPRIGVIAKKDTGFWNFDHQLLEVNADGMVRRFSRPSQLWGCRTDVYREVGGFSGMPRGEDLDLQVRIKIAGYEIATDGRCTAKGEYFQPTGGMFAYEGPITGAPNAQEAARIRDAVMTEELQRKYPGIVRAFDPEKLGSFRLNPHGVKKLARKYAEGRIRLTADGVVEAAQAVF